MPPISPQGSRTGLVTALVIFVILFVTSTILFIYENAERRNLQERVQNLESQRADLATDAVMTSPDVVAVIDYGKQANPPLTGVEALLAQRRNMAKAITGQEAPPDRVNAAVQQAMAKATAPEVAAANVRVAKTAGLTEVVNALANGVTALQQRLAEMQNALNAAAEEKKQLIASRDELAKQKEKEIADIRTSMQQEQAQLVAYRTGNLNRVQQIEKNTQAALAQQQESNAQLSAQLSQATETIKKNQAEIDALTRRLKNIRPGTNEPTVQKEDGRIVKVPTNDTVVINLGQGDQIVMGMTFEVYDQQTGIPALGDAEHGLSNTDMPEGKASIQVIRILPGFSECRVVRRKPGYGVNIGDMIANLVYDSTQKYNFIVYGDFDLNNDGRPEAGDADVIKQLITRWGARVTTDVNINTDFIVMGVEPKAEPPSKDDDPVVRQQKLEAQQALDRYLNVLKQAETLNIPIMNQNRFLNFVGYQSQVNR